MYIITRKSICHRTKFQVLRIDQSVQHLISRDQPKDPHFLTIEPVQDINILNETAILPSVTTVNNIDNDISSKAMPTHTVNESSLVQTEDNNVDANPNTTILHTVIQRLEKDGSIPIAAEQSMVKELENVLDYKVWEPVKKKL